MANKSRSAEHSQKISDALKGRKHNWVAGRPANTANVLWSKVDKCGEDECWNWLGVINTGGYGRTEIKGKSYYAHRVIYDLAHPNTITLAAPKNKVGMGFLMHTCDNPKCCNPKHLIVADQKANMQDRKQKGRYVMPTGEKHQRSVFTDVEIAEILRLHNVDKLTGKELAMKFNKKISTVKSLIYRNKGRGL